MLEGATSAQAAAEDLLSTLARHDPTIIELAQGLSELGGVEAVNISIYEMDRKVENAKITIEGGDIGRRRRVPAQVQLDRGAPGRDAAGR